MRVHVERQIGAVIVAALVLAVPATASAQGTGYDEAYARYLTAARAAGNAGRALWMTDLTSDLRARYVNDLVTIRVIESLSASGSANSNVGKNGSASASFPGEIGTQLGRLLPMQTGTAFNGSGGTTRTTELFVNGHRAGRRSDSPDWRRLFDPLRRLHGAQAATTFSQLVTPPMARGMT